MKKVLINYGGIILFYLVIIFGILFLNYDSNYMQKETTNNYQIKENYTK